MKIWEIDEFLKECEALCRNPYSYDYSRMPKGFCNGHEVSSYENSWHSIVVDGSICNMAVFNEEHPEGSCQYQIDKKNMNALEYVRYILSK